MKYEEMKYEVCHFCSSPDSKAGLDMLSLLRVGLAQAWCEGTHVIHSAACCTPLLLPLITSLHGALRRCANAVWTLHYTLIYFK